MKGVFLFLLSAAACSGCPPQPLPTPLPSPDMAQIDMGPSQNPYGMTTCPTAMTVTFADVCDGMFVKEGLPGVGLSCFHCTGASSCFDGVDTVYCAKGKPGCLDDDACVNVNDGEDGAPNNLRAKKLKRHFKKIPAVLKARP